MNAISGVLYVSQYHDMTPGQLFESYVQLGALLMFIALVIWICLKVLF